MNPTASTTTELSVLDAIRVSGILTGVVILIVTWFLVRFISAALTRIGNRLPDKRLTLNQISTLLSFALSIAGIVLAVSAAVTLSREVVLAITGTAAVTLGFALKDLAASILAGLVVILDRPFQVGDRIFFNGLYGEVSAIGLRSVRIVTLEDQLVTIPNNKFLTDIVTAGSWGKLDMLNEMDFYIGQDQNVAEAKRIIEEALFSSRYSYNGKPWVVLVSQAVHEQHFAVRLRAQGYVLDIKYEQVFRSDVYERVLEGFARAGIKPPAQLQRVSS